MAATNNRQQDIDRAIKHLSKNDRILRDIIRHVGPCLLKPKRNYYQILVRSIVSQQISTAAARTILGRLIDHLAPEKMTPDAMSKLSLQDFRGVGISQQKANYLIDLTDRVRRGELQLSRIQRHSDEHVVRELVQVKGIGVWTAHMFMIFALGRMDVLAVGDLGVRSAIQKRYGLAELPKPDEIEVIAQPWRPYASIACWYLWRSLEIK